MQSNACKEQIGTGSAIDEAFPSVELAVAALVTNKKITSLAEIARKRMERLACQSFGQRLRGMLDPDELVNKAVLLILSGKRRARAQNLASFPAFYNYVQGVLQSVISHELERLVREGQCIPADTLAESEELPAAGDVVAEVASNEVEATLRRELKAYAADPADIDTALGISEEPLAAPDSLRLRRRVHRLRRRARKLLLQQAVEAGFTPTPNGGMNL